MAAKKKTAPTKPAKPQKQRFIDAVREHEADETGEALERVFGKVIPPATPRKPTSE
jgi:hypothetical protein